MIVIRKILIFSSVIIICQYPTVDASSGENDQWSSVSCPDKWINFERSCYLLVRDAPVRWHEALKRCNETLAHLVSVNTLPEAKFLSRLLSETDLTRKIWLTSGYLTTDGSYEWSGDGEKFSFYFWHQNDNMEHGFVAYVYTNDEYKWSTIKSGDVGYYICEINKSDLHKLRDYGIKPRDYGLSPLESVDIPKAPRFVEEPSDTISYSNGPIHWVELRCRAEGNPQPTYKWFKGSSGQYIDPKLSSNVVQVDGNLMINEIVPSKDFGFYFCVASNDYGTIRSRKVSLNSAYVKEFPSTRLDVYASQGLGKNVPCQAPDHFPQSMSFAWMYESVKQFLPETERIFISSDGTLYFSYLTKGDQKKYSCTIVINELQAGHYGPFFTIKVDSNKLGSPDFKPNIPDEFPRIYPSNAQLGKSAWIECFAYGKPAPKYKWERLDKTLNNETQVLKNYGRKLYFRSLKNSDGGTYRCIAENSQGIAIKEISLTVQSAPVFLNQPQDLIVEVSGSVTITCEAFGSPKVEYEWFRNGKPLNPLLLPQDDQERIVVDFNRLTIRKTELRDSGCYQCFAANSLGHLSTSAHVLVKNFGATLAKEPQNQLFYAFAGTNVILPCKVEGLPKPSVTWLYESRPVNYGWQYALTKGNHLKIIQVASVDAGLYTCSTNNIYGTSSISIRLKVLPPLKLEIDSSSSKYRSDNENDTFTCKPKSDICSTCVELPMDWSFNCQNTKQFSMFSDQKFINSTNKLYVKSFVTDLDGVLTCKSSSPAGFVSVVASITPKSPPKSVVQLKVANVTERSVTLTWKMPSDSTSNDLSIEGYKILYRLGNETVWKTLKNWTEHSWAQTEKYHLDNSLTPNTVYEFSVMAKNKFGWSRQSWPSNKIKTSTSFPYGIVEDLNVVVERPGHILVQWKPLHRSYWASDNIGYIVEWSLLNSSNSSQQSVTLGDSTISSYILQVSDALKTKNECVNFYSIQVRAFNDQGRGPAAGPVNTSSNVQMGVPRVKIKHFVGSILNESSVNLSWTINIPKSLDLCQKLLAYQVYYWSQSNNKKDGNSLIVPKNVNGCTISGLQSATLYYFQLVPITSAGRAESSNILSLEMLRRGPKSAPSFVTVNQNEMTKENFVEVSWPAIAYSSYDEEIIGYKLHLYESSASLPLILDVFSKDLSSSLPSVRLEQLKSFHMYKLEIQAYSRGGLGPLSEPVIFRFGLNSSSNSFYSSSWVFFMFLYFSYQAIFLP